jgi:hypothetical protein
VGTTRARPLVLDAGALIQFERGDRRTRVLVEEATNAKALLAIPAGVLGQVWRDGSKQARLAALLKGRDTIVEPLDKAAAQAAGAASGQAGTVDVIDATVVLIARRRQAVVVTSDADDLRRLDPGVRLVSV